MKIIKALLFFILLVILVFLFWSAIGIITVLMGEIIGVRPGSIILGLLGFLSVKLAWNLTLKLTKTKK